MEKSKFQQVQIISLSLQVNYVNKASNHSATLPGLTYSSEPVVAHFQRTVVKEFLNWRGQSFSPAPALPLSPLPLYAFQPNSHYWVCIVNQEPHSLNIVKNPHWVRESAQEGKGGKTDGEKGRDREKGSMLGTRKPEGKLFLDSVLLL